MKLTILFVCPRRNSGLVVEKPLSPNAGFDPVQSHKRKRAAIQRPSNLRMVCTAGDDGAAVIVKTVNRGRAQ
jgi:hypothetical protein